MNYTVTEEQVISGSSEKKEDPRINTQVRERPFNPGDLLIGAAAGLLATGPMSAGMLILYKVFLPPAEKYPLPPRLITDKILHRSRVGEKARKGVQKQALTWAAHFAYGSATGSLFPWFYRLVRLPAVISGMIYAMLIWAGSYLGWLPAANILPPATKAPTRRNLVMIAAHLVWGSVLGLVTEKLEGYL